MRRFPLVLVLTILAAASTVACSAFQSVDDPFTRASEGPRADHLEIEVVNRSHQDATVHVLSRVRRIRLGMSPSATTRMFTIDWRDGPDQLRAEIDRLAGATFITRPITATAGEPVRLVIEALLTNSYLQN